jgi:hypothetical protein
VVVAVGLTVVLPLADEEENVPGEIATVVAPEVFQLSELLAPELIPVGLALKELIAGSEPFSEEDALDEPQPGDAAKAHKISASAQKRAFPTRRQEALNLLVWRNLAELMRTPSALLGCGCLRACDRGRLDQEYCGHGWLCSSLWL